MADTALTSLTTTTSLTTGDYMYAVDGGNSRAILFENVVASITLTESQISDLQSYLLDITGEPLGDLSDVTISAPAVRHTLSYNGSAWVNRLDTDFKTVYNATGSTIAAGTFVRISGSAGGVPLITVADKDTDSSVSGITIAAISASTAGVMQAQGTIQETFINTNGLTAGDLIYLGDAGGFTTTAPTVGNIIRLGSVGVVAPSSGSLILDCPGYVITTGEIADFHDLGPNAQTGTTYTLVLADKGKSVTMDNGSANTLTIPANADVAFDVGTVINVIQIGAGVTTIEGDTGVTLNGVSAGSGAINTRYQGVSLLKVATNTWVASGDIATVA